MLRVIAGGAKGIRLESPKWKGTRPMTDKVRGAVFNILQQDVIDASVLDLYAGTGAVGLEALSRGARRVDFVDKSNRCVRLIKDNIQKCRFGESTRVFASDAAKYLEQASNAKYDLVFFTPPYAIFDFVLLDRVSQILAEQGTIVAEMASKDQVRADLLASLEICQERVYGDTRLLFLDHKGEEVAI